MIYAQINEDNICVAISDMGNVEASNPQLIKIDTFDTSLLGKHYNNGIWEDSPEPEPETLSENEQAILDTAINTEYLVCLADLGL